MKMVDSQSPKICGETVAKYITENRENVEILDIGATNPVLSPISTYSITY
jgi:hypothetical protein